MISRTMRSATSAVMSAESDRGRDHLDHVGADDLQPAPPARGRPRAGRPRSCRRARASRCPERRPGRARRRRPRGRTGPSPATSSARSTTAADAEVAHVVHEDRGDPALALPAELRPRPASSRAGRSGRSGAGRRGPARPAGTSACRARPRRPKTSVPVSVWVSKWTRPTGPCLRRRRGCRARRSSGRRRGRSGSRRPRAPSPTSVSIASWVRAGSAGQHRRVAEVDDPQLLEARRPSPPGGARPGSSPRGSPAGRSACPGRSETRSSVGAPTMTTSTPASSAASSV